jgi:tetratricopeptide (TPR) repeat protein
MRKVTPLDEAMAAVREEDYLRGFTLFLDIYGSEDAATLQSGKAATGLSFFGLAVAMIQKKYKPATDLCKRALSLEFYNPDHYVNLTKVYAAAGNRKKAIETAEAGLKIHPEHDPLIAARKQLGIRARPAVPFLDRTNPINVSLGHARHAKKVADAETRKKPRG